MQWVTLTADDILSQVTLRERDDFSKTSPGVAVPDRLVPILANLVAEIRGNIASHSGATLSAGATLIPPGFKAHAVAIGRWRMLTSIPGYNPGESRKLDYETAVTFFRDVAKGINRPEAADDATAPITAESRPAGVEVVTSAPSRTGRDRMDGI
jgi:hypothetical protein